MLRLAAKAKSAMDQQYIYPGCCFMRIEFSKLQEVTVKYNNDKSRFVVLVYKGLYLMGV